MPTYEYVCKACGHQLEVVQAFTDADLSVCPSCGGDLKKIFGNVGIVFKGSGFYKTDSRGSSSTASTTGPKSEPAAPPSEASSSTSPSESSPAPAAASTSSSASD